MESSPIDLILRHINDPASDGAGSAPQASAGTRNRLSIKAVCVPPVCSGNSVPILKNQRIRLLSSGFRVRVSASQGTHRSAVSSASADVR